jgi:hypothetical protein
MPQTTPIRPISINEVKGDTEWSALEQALLKACREGVGVAGVVDLPEIGDQSKRVRPELITYLLRGGCDDPNGARPLATGVQLFGAWIDGKLNFDGGDSELPLLLGHCRLPDGVNFMDARLQGVILQGCEVAKVMDLQRISIKNDLFIKQKTKITCMVNLGGAKIGGQLNCQNAKFENPKKNAKFENPKKNATSDNPYETALNCNSAVIEGSVFLDDGFHAKGMVNLVSAQIGGQLNCKNANFDNPNGVALSCNGAVVAQQVFLDDGFHANGLVDFTAATIGKSFVFKNALGKKTLGEITALSLKEARLGVLSDDATSWGRADVLDLSGLRYDRIDSDMSLQERLAIWGRKSERKITPVLPSFDRGEEDFDPQPHTQLAKVLARQGQRADATRVRYEREDQYFKAVSRRAIADVDYTVKATLQSWQNDLIKPLHFLYKKMFGYGHHPGWSLYWIIGLVGFATWLYGGAYSASQMAPNTDMLIVSGLWQDILAGNLVDSSLLPEALGDLDSAINTLRGGAPVCAKQISDACVAPLALWEETRASVDYESFNPFLYGVDLFVPLDALGQETTWAPAKDRGVLGWFAYYARMPIQMFGWGIAVIGAAVVTGVVGRSNE